MESANSFKRRNTKNVSAIFGIMRVFCSFALLFLLLLISCTPSEKSKSTSFSDKKNILDSLSVAPCPDLYLFGKELQKRRISPMDVYEYCTSNYDTVRTKKLIFATCWNADNFVQVEKKEYFPAVPYDLNIFVDKVLKLKEPHHKVFMDIGSGNGEKMYTALCIHFTKALGVEYSEKNCKMLHAFLSEFEEKHLIENRCQDALVTDSSFYNRADFLYMFSPISDNALMAKLYLKIMNSMKNGSTLFEVRYVYNKELTLQSRYNFPETSDFKANGFAIKKINNEYFYTWVNALPLNWQKLPNK